MRVIPPLLLAATLYSFARTYKHERYVGDNQPLRQTVSQLPGPQRETLLSSLGPVILSDLEEAEGKDLSREELAQDWAAILNGLRTEEIETPKGSLRLVQAYTSEGCGVVGNFLFYLLDTTGRTLLHNARAPTLVLVPRPYAYPEVLFGTHVSVGDEDLHWYKLQGATYKLVACGWSTMGYPGHYHSRPEVSSRPCAHE